MKWSNKLLVVPAGAFIVAFLSFVVSLYLSSASWAGINGYYVSQAISFSVGVIVTLTVFICPLALIGIIFRRTRIASALWILSAVAIFVGIRLGHKPGWELRMRGFEQVAENGKPLVAAITKFERDHGYPPMELGQLQPDYLKAVPGTGLAESPHFGYEPFYNNGSWRVFVYTLRDGLASTPDELVYDPSRQTQDTNRYSAPREINGWYYYTSKD